jgi:hypothetical protein
MAMRETVVVALAPLAMIAGACGCGFHPCDGCTDTREQIVLRQTVESLDAGKTLVSRCVAITGEKSLDVLQFHANPGSIVEQRTVYQDAVVTFNQYDPGSAPPDTDAFWCSDKPMIRGTRTDPWTCFEVTGADPPATVLALDSIHDASPFNGGYLLKLRVNHPGTLYMVTNERCRLAWLGLDAGPSGIADASAAMEMPFAELTIL